MSRPKRPARGSVGPGSDFNPAAPAPPADEPAPPHDRAMPAPQSPLPAAEVERLKARARKSRSGRSAAGQPDPGGEPRRKP